MLNIKYLIAIILFSSFLGYSQIIEYKKSLEIKNDNVIKKFEQKNNLKWLSILPSFNYDIDNQSFNVGISFSNFSRYYQQKSRNKIQLAQLETRLEEKLSNDLEKLELKIESFKIDYDILKNKIDLFKFEFDLFQISKGKYANNEITSEEFLSLKITYLTKKNNLKNSLLKLQLKAKAIQQKTKSDTLLVSLNILSNSINNYD